MFAETKVTEIVLGPAIQAGLDALKVKKEQFFVYFCLKEDIFRFLMLFMTVLFF